MPFEFAASLLYQIPQRNYQLNDFKWNWIRIWWFCACFCSFKSAVNFNHWPSTMRTKEEFFYWCFWVLWVFARLSTRCTILLCEYLKWKEMKTMKLVKKQCQLFFSYFFVFFASKSFFYSRSFFNFVIMKKFEGCSSVIWVKCESYGREWKFLCVKNV